MSIKIYILILVDVRYIDPTFVKLFQTAQLIIEYLLHSQGFLVSQRQQLTSQLADIQAKCADITHKNETQASQLLSAKKETRALRKTVYAFQIASKMPNHLGNIGATTGYHVRPSNLLLLLIHCLIFPIPYRNEINLFFTHLHIFLHLIIFLANGTSYLLEM